MAGVSIGPSLLLGEDWKGYGITGTLYSWYFVMPYYGYTYVFQQSDIHELGFYLKLPIPISGKRYFDLGMGG
jgi:hypothetical protein